MTKRTDSRVVPRYLWGISSRTPQTPKSISAQVSHKMVWYLHIAYTHPPVSYFYIFNILLLYNLKLIFHLQLLQNIGYISYARHLQAIF